MSVIEIFAGLGGILAPSIGGFLYDLHNFTTPFYFSGSLQLLTLLGTYIFKSKTHFKIIAFSVINPMRVLIRRHLAVTF